MNQSPAPSLQTLIDDLSSLIKQGSKTHRVKIKDNILDYDDPHLNSLHQALRGFQQQPNPTNFENIRAAVINCQSHQVRNLDYDSMLQIIETVDQMAKDRNKSKRP